MPRSLAVLLACGFLILSSLAMAGGASAATIAATTTCSNGVDNTGGLGLICEVTVVNTITAAGGTATVTVRECHGAAGDPEAACTTETSVLTELVTAVTQCNDSINGGGGTLRCSVEVTNNFVDLAPAPTGVTVNQCVGSGEGGVIGDTIFCDPFPATTSGATITQCNGSANGLTLVELRCTATGTQSAAHAVTINQCNGSANGGGALVICSASIENNAVAAPTPTPTASPVPAPTATPAGGPTSGGATPRVTPPSTDGVRTADAPGSGPIQVALMGIFLVALIVLTATLRSARSIRLR